MKYPQSMKTIFSETFDSPASVVSNGGTINGSPVFRDGLIFDGSSDYVSYNTPNTLLAKEELSIVCEFYPDFDWDDGAGHYFTDATNGERVAIYKSSGGNLALYINGTVTLNSNGVLEYQQYWKVGERNVLVVTTSPGANAMYLNGNLIDSTAISYTPAKPTGFYIGATYSGGNPFDGRIKSFSIHNRLFTADEAQALYDGSLFNFQNKATIWLDMEEQSGKPSGTNLISDSDMEAVGVGDWPAVNCTASKETSDPFEGSQHLRVAYDGVHASGGVYQTVVTANAMHRLYARVRSDGTAIPIFTDGPGVLYTGTNDTDWQYVYTDIIPGGASLYFGSSDLSSGYVELDYMFVERIEQKTLDKSGKGNDFKLGDGTTSSTFPSFSAPGFDLDGSSDYIMNDNASGIYNNAEQSIVMCFKPDFDYDLDSYKYLFDSANGSRYFVIKFNNAGSNVLQIQFNGTNIAFIPEADYKDYWKAHGVNVIVFSAESGNTSVYLNGEVILDEDSSAWDPVDTSAIYLGASYSNTNNFDGEIFHFSTYDFCLSPVQAEHITNQLMVEYH